MNDYKLVKNTEWKEVEINGEIEEIPEHWTLSTIDESFKVVGGGTPSTVEPSYWNGTIPWLGPKEMSKEKSQYIGVGEKYISEAGAKKLGNKKVLKNSVIISTRAPVGYVKFAKNDLYTNQGCHSLLPSELVLNEYFYYWLIKNQNILDQNASGTTFKELSSGNLKSIEFCYAHKEEQTSIADILSSQESIIQNIESLIAKYESRFQYLSEELLSGRLRVKEVDGQLTLYKNADDNWKEVEINGEMKEIPSDWQHSVVNKLFEIQRGKVLSKGYIQINAGNYPVYSSATENNGCIGRINSYMFDGEFLTWNTDGYAGSVFYRNGQFNCTNICGILKAKQPMNLHSFKFFLEPRFKKNVIHGGQLTNLKLMSSHVEGIELAYPQNSELELISLVFDKQEKLIEQQKELLSKEKQKFDWLLDNLLSGKYLIKEN